MAEARSGFSVEWIVRCLCSLNLLRPGFLLPVTGGPMEAHHFQFLCIT